MTNDIIKKAQERHLERRRDVAFKVGVPKRKRRTKAEVDQLALELVEVYQTSARMRYHHLAKRYMIHVIYVKKLVQRGREIMRLQKALGLINA